MGYLEKAQVLERFRADASNSSHFVWLLADLRYYETKNRWVFAYTTFREVALIALEPLIPGAPIHFTERHTDDFRMAWAEFTEAAGLRTFAFISVYDSFAEFLKNQGFQTVKVGHEPWVRLEDCIPTGNSGKGVRSARNQALLAGLRVEEWKPQEIEGSAEKRAVMSEIYGEWKSARPVNLGGFMNSTDPFAFMSDRRYFILHAPDRIEGYLVATPVPGVNAYFLEDLILRRNPARGSGELLTLEAMVALKESGAAQASLGVVSLTTLETESAHRLPPLIRTMLVTIPRYLSTIYNFNGMEIYRKRFKPHAWTSINVAVKNETGAGAAEKVSRWSDTRAWLKVMVGLLVAFKPRLQINSRWLIQAALKPWRKYPATVFTITVSSALFAGVNRFGTLPNWTLQHFGFFGNAPVWQWVYRSVISDFLYFSPSHFLSCSVPLFAFVFWAEKSHRRSFILPFLIACSVFDDLVNYWFLIKPLSYLHPALFSNIVAYKDVGGSLILSILAGLQICQFRVLREPLFALLVMAGVIALAFSAKHMEWLYINLDHPILFILGFLIGKARFGYLRRRNEAASKGKPPAAKSVAGSSKKAA